MQAGRTWSEAAGLQHACRAAMADVYLRLYICALADMMGLFALCSRRSQLGVPPRLHVPRTRRPPPEGVPRTPTPHLAQATPHSLSCDSLTSAHAGTRHTHLWAQLAPPQVPRDPTTHICHAATLPPLTRSLHVVAPTRRVSHHHHHLCR